MRTKYRSVYTFSEVQRQEVVQIIETLQAVRKLITQVFPFQTLQLQSRNNQLLL
jgi:hypothetical protein